MFLRSSITLFSLISSQIVMTSDDSKLPRFDQVSKAWQIGVCSSAAPKFIASLLQSLEEMVRS